MRTLTHRNSPKREEREAKPGEPCRLFKGAGVYISSRSIWRGFWYAKGSLVKWNRADQVTMGMRWNHYLTSGGGLPKSNELSHPCAEHGRQAGKICRLAETGGVSEPHLGGRPPGAGGDSRHSAVAAPNAAQELPAAGVRGHQHHDYHAPAGIGTDAGSAQSGGAGASARGEEPRAEAEPASGPQPVRPAAEIGGGDSPKSAAAQTSAAYAESPIDRAGHMGALHPIMVEPAASMRQDAGPGHETGIMLAGAAIWQKNAGAPAPQAQNQGAAPQTGAAAAGLPEGFNAQSAPNQESTGMPMGQAAAPSAEAPPRHEAAPNAAGAAPACAIRAPKARPEFTYSVGKKSLMLKVARADASPPQ